MENTIKEKELKTSYDEFGNIGKSMVLVPEKSFIPDRERVGL